jgi:hypothetical protein
MSFSFLASGKTSGDIQERVNKNRRKAAEDFKNFIQFKKDNGLQVDPKEFSQFTMDLTGGDLGLANMLPRGAQLDALATQVNKQSRATEDSWTLKAMENMEERSNIAQKITNMFWDGEVEDVENYMKTNFPDYAQELLDEFGPLLPSMLEDAYQTKFTEIATHEAAPFIFSVEDGEKYFGYNKMKNPGMRRIVEKIAQDNIERKNEARRTATLQTLPHADKMVGMSDEEQREWARRMAPPGHEDTVMGYLDAQDYARDRKAVSDIAALVLTNPQYAKIVNAKGQDLEKLKQFAVVELEARLGRDFKEDDPLVNELLAQLKTRDSINDVILYEEESKKVEEKHRARIDTEEKLARDTIVPSIVEDYAKKKDVSDEQKEVLVETAHYIFGKGDEAGSVFPSPNNIMMFTQMMDSVGYGKKSDINPAQYIDTFQTEYDELLEDKRDLVEKATSAEMERLLGPKPEDAVVYIKREVDDLGKAKEALNIELGMIEELPKTITQYDKKKRKIKAMRDTRNALMMTHKRINDTMSDPLKQRRLTDLNPQATKAAQDMLDTYMDEVRSLNKQIEALMVENTSTKYQGGSPVHSSGLEPLARAQVMREEREAQAAVQQEIQTNIFAVGQVIADFSRQLAKQNTPGRDIKAIRDEYLNEQARTMADQYGLDPNEVRSEMERAYIMIIRSGRPNTKSIREGF